MFVDLKQAYDNIIWNKLWKNLIISSIPTKIPKLIKSYNSNTKCVVRVQGELSKSFEVVKGLGQGDALLPVLFNLVLENVMRRMPQRQTIKVNGNRTLLVYVDDILILGDTKQDTVNSKETHGLAVNQEKTKYMYITREVRSVEYELNLEVGGMAFQQVHDF